jgi:CheY-like chemotaxis protein/HPt (histidine-containing phosphotransfer) domain-containing protein
MSPSAASADGAMAGLAGVRILVADDNPVNRTMAAAMLSKLGCQVGIAIDGAEAVCMHAEQAFDLVLMDCQMPALDGYEATAGIRRIDGERRHTPVIALTSSDDSPEREKCASAGMDGFLPKPLEPQALLDILRRWLSRTSTLDIGKLTTMRAVFGDAEFAALIRLYCDDVPQRIAALQHALAANDPAEMARIAHAFSGSCASIGASTLSGMCKELEARLKDGLPNDVGQRLDAIEAECRQVSLQLQAMPV